jgi:hypothetical protein
MRCKLALLGLLSGCGSSLEGVECIIPWTPDIDDMPERGVYVASTRDCVGRCAIAVDDVIVAIDGMPVREPKPVYEALADGRFHTVSLDERERKVRIRMDTEQLRELGLVSLESLHKNSMAGRGERAATRIGDSQFYSVDRTWNMPYDMWGTTYILFDIYAGDDPRYYFSAEQLDALLADLTVPLVVLAVVKGEDLANAPAMVPLADDPRIILAITAIQGNEWGIFDGYIGGQRAYIPNVSVIDCHGVVHWNRDRVSAGSVESSMREAIEVAAMLEQQRAAGGCWTFE